MNTNGLSIANGRQSFAKTLSVVEFPDLLDVQIQSFNDFLQAEVPPKKRKPTGLHQAFLTNFPISDTGEIFALEFLEYYFEKPKYTVTECRDRELTYAAALKARLRLSSKAEPDSEDWIDTVEQDVYLGTIPIMTDHGTFIINGAERVIVSQLHRSPGVFFSDAIHPNGTRIFTARIIPLRGSWVEFSTDINNVIYVYIDRKKKLPVTTLLRALGYGTDEELMSLFSLIEDVSVDKTKIADLIGRKVAADVVDTKTGEIFLTKGVALTEEHVSQIKKSNVKRLKVLRGAVTDEDFILRTLEKDTSRTVEDALETIYRQLRSTDAPDIETARGLISKLFFNPKRYDLGEVGRFRMNDRLKVEGNLDITTLTIDDIVRIVNYLIDMDKGKNPVDDIDHLGNRRVRTVGEQLGQQFSLGLSRMARTIKERMNLHTDKEHFTPADLVNARTITSVVNSFFGTNQLSQFMDQTNPLAEMTHKRRMSALGPGGLTRERAGFEVRDVHYTHYGRLCPIETPEGPNIGLISSLCIHARVNDFGFIETPYRKVKNGKVTDEIIYLTAEKEEGLVIAPATTPLDGNNRFVSSHVRARQSGDYVVVPPVEVELIDVAPNQIVSAAAALIPFLEHDDANRALMGSNMQRQAVPLLRPEAPLVGTGLEGKIARDSRSLILAESNGVIEYVDSSKIVIRYDDNLSPTEKLISFEDTTMKTYDLVKFFRTNQDTCINQRPVVREGQRVKAGDVLADGASTQHGELALGRNLLVAFMPWRGYNFEDAIIISERLVAEDIYTSIHIEEFTSQVRDTKRGEEEFTREIPNVSEEATRELDENGIVRLGAEVKESDILIGKITPKGETDPTPEEKLLRAIFGDKAGDVKDASLKASPGVKGIVIDTKLFSRKGLRKDGANVRREDRKQSELLDRQFKHDVRDLNEKLCTKLGKLFNGDLSTGIKDVEGKIFIRSGVALNENTFFDKMKEDPNVNFALLDSTEEWVEDKRKANVVRRMFGNYKQKYFQLESELRHEKSKLTMGDELQPGIMQMAKVYIAKKRKLSVGDKMSGRHGNKGVVAKIVPTEDMPFLPDGTPVDIILNPLGVPSRMNLGQLFETALGWAAEKLGVRFATPIFDGASWTDVQGKLREASLPESSVSKLLDGRTGQQFDQDIMVGKIYMLKLAHLVDDKIHARSIGPYSLITQQPLGGKAQFGGQRFGEMEVWALEAYGASYTLQEMLTVKSDDVQGRTKAYETIVRGENLQPPSIPESFNVLVRELQGIGLELKLE